MLEQFEEFVRKNQLFTKSDSLLLAISGGIDSTALFHLLRLGGYNFACAHCNYQLRGEDSNLDEDFVTALARSYHFEFHKIHFDTRAESLANGTGIQETARQLRYNWFRQLSSEFGYDYILTAHQMNDNTETFLFNVSRSTGISGLHGIPIRNGNILRPLIFAKRDQIEHFISENGFGYRNDASNAELKYQRNKLRQQVIPNWENIRADLHESVFKTSQRLSGFENMAMELIKRKWTELLIPEENRKKISIDQLQNIKNLPEFLYYNLRTSGFSYEQCQAISDSFQHTESRVFKGIELVIEKSGQFLFIEASLQQESIEITVNIGDTMVVGRGLCIEIERIKVKYIDYLSGSLYLDPSGCKFPLLVRNWKPGDKMKPLGMNGHKNISDILTDLKIPHSVKKNCLIIENSDNKVIGLFPDRPSDDFKAHDNSSEVLCFRLRKL